MTATVFARPKCVLFDLDGTLVDTAPDLGYAANVVRRDLGLPPLESSHYRPVASGGARGLLKVALGIDDAHPDFPQRRERFLAVYRNNLVRESCLFQGIDATLEDLVAAGMSWGVVTNKPGWLATPLLDEIGLRSRAACAVGAQEGLQPKPAPDLLLHACGQLKLNARDCVYVGDDRRDIDAARAAGMPCVAAAWGYIGPDEDVAAWNADAVIETPQELPGLWS